MSTCVPVCVFTDDQFSSIYLSLSCFDGTLDFERGLADLQTSVYIFRSDLFQ